MSYSEELIGRIIEALPELSALHAPTTLTYRLLQQAARRAAQELFGPNADMPVSLEPFGPLRFPYVTMGAIDSVDLFGLDELIIFSFYWKNRSLYRRALDLGANIGLHTLLMARCGFEVTAYEPDPHHFEQLKRNLENNGCTGTTAINAAVSTSAGEMEFVRVLGNTTGSHLAGCKPAPYGTLERFPVRVEPFLPMLDGTDLIKMDVEGHERQILLSTTPAQWQDTDAFIEVGNAENAQSIFHHFRTIGVNLFAQKQGWRSVNSIEQMPTSYRDGSLFVSVRPVMPW